MQETPAWFIADSTLTSVGEKRAASARDAMLATLAQIFPDSSVTELEAAVAGGGDLPTIVDRLLATQAAAEASAGDVGNSSAADAAASAAPGPTRRVRFGPLPSESAAASAASAAEQMTYEGQGSSSTDVAADGAMSRLSDEELTEQMAASGITVEPTIGSARGAARSQGPFGGGATLEAVLQGGSIEELRAAPVAQLATGALRIHARIIKTTNELEGGLLTERIVTKFVIECRQLAFRWEVARRYSEFHRFHELLSLEWFDLPALPPKLLLSQECDDVAERMMQLDAYLRALLESPALGLSPLVCTFLDAVDVQSFRGQMLPRLQQMEAADQGARPVPMLEDHEADPS